MLTTIPRSRARPAYALYRHTKEACWLRGVCTLSVQRARPTLCQGSPEKAITTIYTMGGERTSPSGSSSRE